MKLVEDVLPVTTVATREEIVEWTAARRSVLIELLEQGQLALVDVERRAA